MDLYLVRRTERKSWQSLRPSPPFGGCLSSVICTEATVSSGAVLQLNMYMYNL